MLAPTENNFVINTAVHLKAVFVVCCYDLEVLVHFFFSLKVDIYSLKKEGIWTDSLATNKTV